MSTWIKTKYLISVTRRSFWTLSIALVLAISLNNYHTIQVKQAYNLEACTAIETSLPRNHNSHPCQTVYADSPNWLSWLSGESKTPQLHFLDLVELIHYSFN